MKRNTKKPVRAIDPELVIEFGLAGSHAKKTTKIKKISNPENPAGRLGQIVLSYPVELTVLSRFTYDMVIEHLVGTESDSSEAETFTGGSRKLIWHAGSKSSVLTIKTTLKKHGITNVEVDFYPPILTSIHKTVASPNPE
jgi:hypothetical protein